jgi:copper chaperone NosL
MRCPRLIARLSLAIALALVACAPAGPRTVRWGEEGCGYCRMTITDRRFGAQAMGARGRIEAFDSVECLADFVNAAIARTGGERPRAWVSDFLRPGTFIAVDSARFVRLARAGSPMGAGLAAVSLAAPANAVEIAGAPMTWAELLESRKARDTTGTHDAHGAHGAYGAAHAD